MLSIILPFNSSIIERCIPHPGQSTPKYFLYKHEKRLFSNQLTNKNIKKKYYYFQNGKSAPASLAAKARIEPKAIKYIISISKYAADKIVPIIAHVLPALRLEKEDCVYKLDFWY